MSYIPKTISEVVTEYLNRTTFLPAIQREFVWGTYDIEKLFDSIMSDYPISTFLFWKVREENKHQWTIYEFIRDFDKGDPHNKEANLAGRNQDIYLVLDGQQRLTSLFIGLLGSYRYYYYRWRKTKLYLNILKYPNGDFNSEELQYQFQFRENEIPNHRDPNPQYWYLVSDILNYEDAEEAKNAVKANISHFTEDEITLALSNIGRLHTRIHIKRLLNYYEEKSQEYDKVLEAFIRANTGGEKLEYSDILLSTATAKWKNTNAREEIHSFTDNINSIGNGYSFGKDFVLKGCLYLTEGLPIKYKVSNFNRANLEKIESNWTTIKDCIEDTVKLINMFGFSDKNMVAKMSLLPVALYLSKLNCPNFINSSNQVDVQNQLLIQKWLIIALLKGALGGSSDNTLSILQDTINSQNNYSSYPLRALATSINLNLTFSDVEVNDYLMTNYSTQYSYLILSLLCPDRDWKGKQFHEDHIFPKSEFTIKKLQARGYGSTKIDEYMKYYNCILNLELLTDSENREKNAIPFDIWITSRDQNFKERNLIPMCVCYHFDNFLDFIEERKKLLLTKIQSFGV